MSEYFKKDVVKTFGKLPLLVWLFGNRRVVTSDDWVIHSVHYKDEFYIIKSEPKAPLND